MIGLQFLSQIPSNNHIELVQTISKLIRQTINRCHRACSFDITESIAHVDTQQ